MTFRTQYERKRIETNPGSPIRIVYGSELDKNKNIKVTEKGKEDFYAYINSFSDSVNIHVLLARFMNGDKESLLQRAGAYIDISSVPTNINDFMDLAQNAKNLFETLPIETKQAFNNNIMEFMSTIGDKEWIEKMNTSQAEIKKKQSDSFREVTKAHQNAIKPNSVYGDQIVEEQPEVPSPTPDINPLTGNEVR